MQTITLKGYGTNIPPYEAIELGTYDSYGVEQLQIVPSHGWENLSIIASFFPPSGAEPIKVAVLSGGIIDVPPGATAKQSGKGIIVFAGYKANTQLISTNVAYNIRDHKDIASGDPVCPTPSVVDQIVNAAKSAQEDAEKAAGSAKKAEDVADSVRNDADEGKFNGEDGYSPSANVTQIDNGAIISIRDKTGESTATIYNGEDGIDGKDGVQIDDAAVSEDAPWSSKHIIDMLCPPLEESGNPVVCYPVTGYPLGVKAKWEPMQEGSGTPSPENIRPIKGRASVTVERCGANLSKISDISTPNKSLIPVELPTEIVADIEISFDTLNAEIKNVGTAFFLNKADGKWKAITVQDFGISTAGKIPNGRKTAVFHGVTFKTVETVIIENGYCKWSGDVNNFCVSIIQNAPYKPYIGQTNTLTLPETVYGGEVDAVSGEGQDTQKLVILNGTESWNSWGINAYNPAITGFYTYDINDYDAKNTKGICSHLEVPNQDVWGGQNAGIGFATVGSSRYFIFSMLTSSLPDISAGHEVASLKAYLAAQNDAGTPVQIAYKLATPTPFTATGAQPLPALAGANTILTDADSATVTGRADPIKKITDLEDAVASQT